MAHLLSKLAYFRGVPVWLREAECADEGEETCRALLADLGAPGFTKAEGSANIEIVDMDDVLSKLG